MLQGIWMSNMLKLPGQTGISNYNTITIEQQTNSIILPLLIIFLTCWKQEEKLYWKGMMIFSLSMEIWYALFVAFVITSNPDRSYCRVFFSTANCYGQKKSESFYKMM